MADKNIPDLPALLASDLVGGSVMEWYDATSSTNRKMTFTQLATLYQPLDGDLTAIAALSGTDNIYYRSGASTWTSVTIGTGLAFSSGTLSSSATSPPFTDTNTLIKGSSDTTKLMRFEVDGFTTGTTRVLTPPDSNLTLAGIDINQTFTGVQTFTPAARSSGSASAFTFNTPADTGTTASTERIAFSVPGAIVTWATGALTTQRFNVFGADTVAFVGASTLTTAVGNEWASPVAGTNATLTKSIAGRFVSSVAAHVPLVTRGAAAQSGNQYEAQSSDGTILTNITAGGNIQQTQSGAWIGNSGSAIILRGSNANLISFDDGSTYTQVNSLKTNFNFTAPSGFNKTAPGSQVHVVSAAAGTIAAIVGGATSRTAPLIQLQTSAGASLGNVGGCIFDDFADTASTSTDGTFNTIYTHTTVANTLAINGDKITFDFGLTVVSSATATRQIKLAFAGITIFDSTALTFAATGTVRISGYIIRKSSTTCRAFISFRPAGSATILGFAQEAYVTESTLTGLTLTSTNILLLTAAAASTGAASGDIVGVMGTMSVIPAGS